MAEGKRRSVWSPILPVPEDAPAARVGHPTRGDPLRIFSYKDAEGRPLGHVCRFRTSSGEALHLPLTWCVDQDGMRGWRWIQFQRFRPLFGLERLDEFGLTVVAFDEFEADCARKLLPWGCFVSWPGGLKKIDEVDWSPLRGRNVWIWPTKTAERAKIRRDADEGGAVLPRERQPGWQAALKIEKILLGYGCKIVGMADPFSDPGLPDGFGPALADLQEWDEKRLTDWVFSHSINGLGTEIDQRWRKLKGEPIPADPPPPPGNQPVPTGASWEFGLLKKYGELVPCLSNVHDILANSTEWKGVVAFNEFSQRVVKLKNPPYEGGKPGDWESTDDTRTAMFLSRTYQFTPSSALVAEAIEVIARENLFHPPRSWLRGLKWDGVPRLDDWLTDFVGVEKTPYTIFVARWYLMGMVARVMLPGVKFDYCLVLEGIQGLLKSSMFEALAGEWFSDADIDLGNKDSMSALQGVWLHEFAELGSLARHEASRQKSFISRRFDRYRPVYGRREICNPRQVVFGGSTNETWDWNKDPTGGRRFWPVLVKDEVNIEGLRAVREQLFAEAVVRFDAGDKFWPTSAEQREIFDPEQLKREQQDSLVDALHDWVFGQWKDFSLATAAIDGLKLDASKLTRDLQTRIGICLIKLGCTKVEKRNGMIRFWYKPPQKTVTSTSNIAQASFGDEDDAF